MAEIRLAPEVAEDFERILGHLRAHEVADADARLAEILDAIDVPERHPLIGRPTTDGLHELVIGWQSRGFAWVASKGIENPDAGPPRRGVFAHRRRRKRRDRGYCVCAWVPTAGYFGPT